jgi:SAM-dependent methyltransferase
MLEIIATDPLAEEYDQLLAKYQFSPPIRTIACYAENLTELFSENSFDFGYARNCIDHTYDPYKAIIQMLLVVKENHFVCLNHFEKEGELSGYRGLHQWNFYIENNAFLLSGKSIELNISDELSSIGAFVHLETQGKWVIVHIKKRSGIKRQQIERLLAVHEERTRVYRDINIDSILSQQSIRVLLIYALRRLLHKLPLKSNWKYRESEIVPLGLPRPIQNG